MVLMENFLVQHRGLWCDLSGLLRSDVAHYLLEPWK